MSTVTKALILIYIIIAGVVIVVTPILMKLGMNNIFQAMAYWFIFIGGAVLVGFHLWGDAGIWAIRRITGNKIDWFDAQKPESNREPEDWISMVFEDVIGYLVFGFWLVLLILGWMWLLAMIIGWLEFDWGTILFVGPPQIIISFTFFINLLGLQSVRKKAAARKAPKLPLWAKIFIAIFIVVLYVAILLTIVSWI